MNLNILEYEEKLYKEYLIPLFPYLTEDKIFFESRKLRLQNEGFGCFPPITIRIVIGEKEFEFGEYTRLIAPNETKEIYVQEPGIFSHFLRDQNPNIDVKIVFSFQKFGRSYECSLLSDTVGSWVDRLPTSNIDIVLSHEIPLDRLSAKDFERLCYWIVDEERNDKNQKRFKDVLWLGESGVGEQGRDLIATEAETNRSYVFQCKRVDKFTPGQLKEELEKFEKEVIRSPNIKPDIYVLFTSCSITPETKRQGDSLAQQIGMGIEYWPKSRVDKLVRIHEVVRNRFWQVIHQS